jgi:molybdopterin-guanine dinucleotide biosynthesis protein A
MLSAPVDCPDPPADLAARLLASLRQHPATGCAVAFDGERVQPLFALYRPGLAFTAAQALAEDLPVHEWQRQIGVVEVDFADVAAAFANLNTPADFAAQERRDG